MQAITLARPLVGVEPPPWQARDVIQKLQKYLKLHQNTWKLAGLNPVILCQQPKDHSTHSLDQQITQLYIQSIIKHSPFLSLYAKAQLRKTYGNNAELDLFQQPKLLQNIQDHIQKLRDQDRQMLYRWLQENISEYSFKDQSTIIRIAATPNIASKQQYCGFKNEHTFEKLNLLHAVLADDQQDPLPQKLLGHTICQTWSQQYDHDYHGADSSDYPCHHHRHRRALKAISRRYFSCPYFSIETYRAADDRIIFNQTSYAHINQILRHVE